jgi:uncharacterized protein YndB with AHSA1/START domain
MVTLRGVADEDRCALRLTRRLAAAPHEVWHALVDGPARARWLGLVATEVREVEAGRVVEFVLPDSVARIELRPEGETTVLVLDHRDIPEPRGMRAMRIWTRALARLEEAV